MQITGLQTDLSINQTRPASLVEVEVFTYTFSSNSYNDFDTAVGSGPPKTGGGGGVGIGGFGAFEHMDDMWGDSYTTNAYSTHDIHKFFTSAERATTGATFRIVINEGVRVGSANVWNHHIGESGITPFPATPGKVRNSFSSGQPCVSPKPWDRQSDQLQGGPANGCHILPALRIVAHEFQNNAKFVIENYGLLGGGGGPGGWGGHFGPTGGKETATVCGAGGGGGGVQPTPRSNTQIDWNDNAFLSAVHGFRGSDWHDILPGATPVSTSTQAIFGTSDATKAASIDEVQWWRNQSVHGHCGPHMPGVGGTHRHDISEAAFFVTIGHLLPMYVATSGFPRRIWEENPEETSPAHARGVRGLHAAGGGTEDSVPVPGMGGLFASEIAAWVAEPDEELDGDRGYDGGPCIKFDNTKVGSIRTGMTLNIKNKAVDPFGADADTGASNTQFTPIYGIYGGAAGGTGGQYDTTLPLSMNGESGYYIGRGVANNDYVQSAGRIVWNNTYSEAKLLSTGDPFPTDPGANLNVTMVNTGANTYIRGKETYSAFDFFANTLGSFYT